MTHKNLVFYFHFYDEPTQAEKTFGFNVQAPAALYFHFKVANFAELSEVLYDLITENLESKFGVHDWSSRPSNTVDAIGYTTYEVEGHQISHLMAAWHKWFSDNTGNPTKVIEVTGDALQGDDSAVYSFIESNCS